MTILDTPMQDNDADAATIREYLKALLTVLWEQGEGFSGKRPFGNSCWECELYRALVAAKHVPGEIDEEYGDLLDFDRGAADRLVFQLIEEL